MRRTNANLSPGVSLFPFLAVLICTMGALIVLLVAIARNSQQQASEEATLAEVAKAQEAAQAAAAADTAESEALELEREGLNWRIAQLQSARDATAAQLAEERKRLTSVEDHFRRLQAKWEELRLAAKALTASGDADAQQQQAVRDELARLQEEVRQGEIDLEATRRRVQNQPTSYAIVPFQGANGTYRRPLYIECLASRIVLQPEGVAFKTSDFENIGPGNPLAAAVRAGHRRMVEQAQAAGRTEDPYPLFLVRPNGVSAYHVARQALASWDSEFGYEFVEQDWKLKYPPADYQLAEIEQRAADDARVRMQAMERMGGSGLIGQRPVYRASPVRGGIVREGGPAEVEPQRNSLRAVGNRGQGETASESQNPRGQGAAGQESSGPLLTAPEQSAGSASSKGDPLQPRSRAGRPGGSEVSGSTEPGEETEGAPGDQPQSQPTAYRSLAEVRGAGWGLKEKNKNAFRITRPIRVLCRADQFVILPEKGGSGGQSIVLPQQTEGAMEEFVKAVRNHMDEWGMAGPNMTWRPELLLELGPGGEGRIVDLEVLLRDSGIAVRRTE